MSFMSKTYLSSSTCDLAFFLTSTAQRVAFFLNWVGFYILGSPKMLGTSKFLGYLILYDFQN